MIATTLLWWDFGMAHAQQQSCSFLPLTRRMCATEPTLVPWLAYVPYGEF
jgi:hypothetical protein